LKKLPTIGSLYESFKERIQKGVLNNITAGRRTPDKLDKDILEKQLDYSSGLDWVLDNPDQFLRDKGHTLRIYDQMMMDDKISGTINLKKQLALSVPWRIIPASDEERDIEIAEFIEDQYKQLKTPIVDIMHNQLDAMVYGVKVGEKRFKLSEDKKNIVLDDVKHMHSIFFDFEYTEFNDLDKLYIGRQYGGLMLNKKSYIQGEENIHRKFDVFTYPYIKDGNFYGVSDLQNVWTQYNQKFYIIRWRGQYLQNYGQPFPEIRYDADKTTAAEKTGMEDMVKNWQDSIYVMNPSARNENGELIGKFEFKFHEFSSGRATKQFEEAIDQIDKQIERKLLIPDKMGFAESPGGSYNLGENQFNIVVIVVSDHHRLLERSWNKTTKQLVDLNYSDVEDYPRFEFENITNELKSDMLQTILDRGVIDKREKWIRKYINLPDISDREKEEIEEQKKEDQAEARKNMPQQPPLPFDKKRDDGNEDKMAGAPGRVIELKSKESPLDAETAKKMLNTNEADFLRDFGPLLNENINHVGKQIEKKNIVEDKKLAEAKSLKIRKQEINRLIFRYFAKNYFESKRIAVEDIGPRMKKQGIEMKFEDHEADNEFCKLQFGDEWINREWIDAYLKEAGGSLSKEDVVALENMKAQAFEITGNIESEIVKNAWFQIDQGIKNGWTTRQVVDKMADLVREKGLSTATTIARTNATSYFNNARQNLFMSDEVRPDVETFMYSAVMDDATTAFCRAHDGQVIKSSDSNFGFIQPPNHFNCRSTLEPIFRGESEDKDSFFYQWEDATITSGGKKVAKYPEWGSNHNSEGERSNMGDPKVSKPAEGFGR
jgi:SPP1 gp7 family putative phage head morphogenesis protein